VAGVGFSMQACRALTEGERAVLWLGPDEWLLIAPEAEGAALASSLEAALAHLPHSLVDVSHRQGAYQLHGPQATTLLAAGCPLDLDESAFPIGMCTRTVLAKAEVVLWRRAQQTFHLEVARSFVAYVSRFLAEAAQASAPDGHHERDCNWRGSREDACSGPGDRWRRGRGEHPLSPDQERLDGCGAHRAYRAHRGLHVACRGAAAALQYELHRRA